MFKAIRISLKIIGITAAVAISLMLLLFTLSWLAKIRPDASLTDVRFPTFSTDTLADKICFGPNFITTVRPNLYLIYLEGKPSDRGYAAGALMQGLIERQEQYFVEQIRELVPSEGYLRLLKYFVRLFNYRLEHYVPDEFRQEIFGISRFASPAYNFIGDPYERILNYHAAHDIGHTLQNLGMVPGCTALALWGGNTTDSAILVARNFDFYVGEAFAREKVLLVCRPDSGIPFASVTWGGMLGVVSGMNQAGLTVTLNAARTGIPLSAKLPVTLLAREILQYASTLEEAVAIARRREIFVAEALLIASAKQQRAIVIERTPERCEVFVPTAEKILYTNHFQGQSYNNDMLNLQNIRESASAGRLQRLCQLADSTSIFTPWHIAALLRNANTLGGVFGGYGNEQAINQFVAHHSVIFAPQQSLIWLSAGPYQLGEYVAFRLDSILNQAASPTMQPVSFEQNHLTIPADSSLMKRYGLYRQWLSAKNKLQDIRNGEAVATISRDTIDTYLSFNKHFFGAWVLAGDFFAARGDTALAKCYYTEAQKKIIPSANDKEIIANKIEELNH